MKQYHFSLRTFPPSVNQYWRTVNNKTMISAAGREFRRIGLQLVGLAPGVNWDHLPIGEPVAVEINLYPPDRRRRDVDNYSKGVLDLITHAGLWHDDNQAHELTVRMCDPIATGLIEILITCQQPKNPPPRNQQALEDQQRYEKLHPRRKRK